MAAKKKLSFDALCSALEATPGIVAASAEPLFDEGLDLANSDASRACAFEIRYAGVSAWLLTSSRWFKPDELAESILAEDQDGALTQDVGALQKGKDLSVALVNGWGPMVGKLCVRCAEGTALLAFSSADLDDALSRKELLEILSRAVGVELGREEDFDWRELGADGT